MVGFDSELVSARVRPDTSGPSPCENGSSVALIVNPLVRVLLSTVKSAVA